MSGTEAEEALRQPVVVKIGGTVASDTDSLQALLEELVSLRRAAVLVHGGGKRVSEMSGLLGMTPRFIDGIRLTSAAEMQVVDMVLAGEVNTALVRAAARAGARAVGLTGSDAGLLTGRTVAVDGMQSRTARPQAVEPRLLRLLLSDGLLPVLATVASGEDGHGVNINADDAAQAIAEALPDSTLCYLSDIPGVLDAEGLVMDQLDSSRVEQLIAAGVARDGMAAKLRSCTEALAGGVREVVIGQFRQAGDLARLLAGRQGTRMLREDAG